MLEGRGRWTFYWLRGEQEVGSEEWQLTRLRDTVAISISPDLSFEDIVYSAGALVKAGGLILGEESVEINNHTCCRLGALAWRSTSTTLVDKIFYSVGHCTTLIDSIHIQYSSSFTRPLCNYGRSLQYIPWNTVIRNAVECIARPSSQPRSCLRYGNWRLRVLNHSRATVSRQVWELERSEVARFKQLLQPPHRHMCAMRSNKCSGLWGKQTTLGT